MSAALMLMAVLWSCLPDPLEVRNIPRVKEEIVVNTQILSDDGLVVFLSKTFGALEASDNSEIEEVLNMVVINDATVVIEGPVSRDTLLFLGTGLYGGIDIDFVEGESYQLIVNSESLGQVTATTTVKPQVLFDSVFVERYFNGYDDTLAQVTYYITDPPIKNHYMINVQHVTLEGDIEDRSILNPVGGYTKLVNDDEFQGKIEETFLAFPRDYSAGDTVAVLLSNVSEDYYNFMQLRLDSRLGFVEFVSEPVNYHSNVVGGRGFFNLYVPDVRFFILD